MKWASLKRDGKKEQPRKLRTAASSSTKIHHQSTKLDSSPKRPPNAFTTSATPQPRSRSRSSSSTAARNKNGARLDGIAEEDIVNPASLERQVKEGNPSNSNNAGSSTHPPSLSRPRTLSMAPQLQLKGGNPPNPNNTGTSHTISGSVSSAHPSTSPSLNNNVSWDNMVKEAISAAEATAGANRVEADPAVVQRRRSAVEFKQSGSARPDVSPGRGSRDSIRRNSNPAHGSNLRPSKYTNTNGNYNKAPHDDGDDDASWTSHGSRTSYSTSISVTYNKLKGMMRSRSLSRTPKAGSSLKNHTRKPQRSSSEKTHNRASGEMTKKDRRSNKPATATTQGTHVSSPHSSTTTRNSVSISPISHIGGSSDEFNQITTISLNDVKKVEEEEHYDAEDPTPPSSAYNGVTGDECSETFPPSLGEPIVSKGLMRSRSLPRTPKAGPSLKNHNSKSQRSSSEKPLDRASREMTQKHRRPNKPATATTQGIHVSSSHSSTTTSNSVSISPISQRSGISNEVNQYSPTTTSISLNDVKKVEEEEHSEADVPTPPSSAYIDVTADACSESLPPSLGEPIVSKGMMRSRSLPRNPKAEFFKYHTRKPQRSSSEKPLNHASGKMTQKDRRSNKPANATTQGIHVSSSHSSTATSNSVSISPISQRGGISKEVGQYSPTTTAISLNDVKKVEEEEPSNADVPTHHSSAYNGAMVDECSETLLPSLGEPLVTRHQAPADYASAYGVATGDSSTENGRQGDCPSSVGGNLMDKSTTSDYASGCASACLSAAVSEYSDMDPTSVRQSVNNSNDISVITNSPAEYLIINPNDGSSTVLDLPWAGNSSGRKLRGVYSGPVAIVPHGEGKLVLADGWTSLAFTGHWENGQLVTPLMPLKNDDEGGSATLAESVKHVRGKSIGNPTHNDNHKKKKKKKYSSRKNPNTKAYYANLAKEVEQTSLPKSIPTIFEDIPSHDGSSARSKSLQPSTKPKYALGAIARSPRDMVIHRSNEEAIHSASLLKTYDQAFLRRSNGVWACAVLADRAAQPTNAPSTRAHWHTQAEIDAESMNLEECMLFVINEDGATKIVKKRHWGKFVRRHLAAEGDADHGTLQRTL